jgi:hypothetical protein
MNGTRIDTLSKILATRNNRRSLVKQGGALALGAGLLGLSGSKAMAQEATPEIPADAPVVLPFDVAIRQGPNAGTELLGYLALITDETGSTAGAFITEDEQTLAVVGQITGRAVNLMFTPAEGQPIFGVGTSAVDLVTSHGAVYTAVGGPLVGPEAGDNGDWAVVTDYDLILDGSLTVGEGTIGANARNRRSPMCRSCVQSCKALGNVDVDLCASFCGPFFGGPCTCDDPGFSGGC